MIITLNLLDEKRKKNSLWRRVLMTVQKSIEILLFFVLIICVAISIAQYSLEKNFEVVTEQTTFVNNNIDTFNKEIVQINNHLTTVDKLQKEYLGNSYNSGGGKRGILYRLSMQKPSLTLLCTPSQKQTERCHPLEERPLTIREYARIQTFDDSYEFIGSLNSQYKQIGNAVPVELAKYMGNSLLKLL